MAYWLIKSEPSAWSWEDQLQIGTTDWEGVRNYQASNHMKQMRCGDLAFFYHSVTGKEIVGIVEIVKEYYPDPTDEKGRFGMVDVKARTTLPIPVPLADIKANPEFADLGLVRQGRLSVMPVPEDLWKKLCHMGGIT
jgi:predicted RNA-binding protein with PUA-like domain